MTELLSPAELEARLRAIGAARYHNRHPFHRMLHGGQCSKGQVQAWAINRYYYQALIPIKDASLIARCDDQAIRRIWRQRLEDHDGDGTAETGGGIDRWLALTDGLGLDRAQVVSTKLILPGTRFAVEAYVHFVREKSLLEAIASSLTELFSPDIIGERVRGMLEHYDYVTPATLAYFDKRPPQAARDADFALTYVKEHARTPEQQRQVLAALEFKCDVLWSMLDALHHAYVTPGLIPPGAFRPGRRRRRMDDAVLAGDSRPRLAPGVRLHFDTRRDAWVLLAPERVIETEGPASEILRRCDGSRTLDAIIDELAQQFAAERAVIAADVAEMLAELRDKAAGDRMTRARSARHAGGAHPSLPARLPLLLEPARARGPARRARHRDLGARVPRGGRARRAAGASLRRRAGLAARPARDHRSGARWPGSTPTSSPRASASTARGLRGLARGRARPRAGLDPGRRAGIGRSHRRAIAAPTRASWRLPATWRRSASRSPSTPCSIAPISSASRRWWSSPSRSAPGGSRSRTCSTMAGRCAIAPR